MEMIERVFIKLIYPRCIPYFAAAKKRSAAN